ncbi:MAG: hypothetical protein ACUVWB_14010, partial [Anaerolineae bacterium]
MRGSPLVRLLFLIALLIVLGCAPSPPRPPAEPLVPTPIPGSERPLSEEPAPMPALAPTGDRARFGVG